MIYPIAEFSRIRLERFWKCRLDWERVCDASIGFAIHAFIHACMHAGMGQTP